MNHLRWCGAGARDAGGGPANKPRGSHDPQEPPGSRGCRLRAECGRPGQRRAGPRRGADRRGSLASRRAGQEARRLGKKKKIPGITGLGVSNTTDTEKRHVGDDPGNGLETSAFRLETKNITHPISRVFGNKMPRKKRYVRDKLGETDSRPYRFDWKRKARNRKRKKKNWKKKKKWLQPPRPGPKAKR